MSQFEPDSMYYPEPPRPQRGCLFYGCLLAVGLLVVMILVVGVGGFFLFRFTNRLVQEYTDTVPMALPRTTLPEAELEALKERWNTFRTNVEEGRAAALTLTSDELNALIQSDEELKDRVAFTIQGDRPEGQISIPLDLPLLGKRYLNAKASFDVSLENGVLIVTLDAAEVKGKPVPAEFLKEFRGKNLAKDLYDDAEKAKVLRRISSLVIRDGTVTVAARPAESTRPAESEPPAQDPPNAAAPAKADVAPVEPDQPERDPQGAG